MKTRLSRAFVHHIYLIPQEDSCTSLTERNYTVLGHSGNVYTVHIGQVPSCSCPDAYSICKHILFVLIKVLKVPRESKLVFV